MTRHVNRRTFLGAMASAPSVGGVLAAWSRTGSSAHTSQTSRRISRALASVPRNETLIISVSDTQNQLSDVDVVNPFVTGTYRTGWHFAYEPLFFYNPWHTSKVSSPSWLPGREGVIPYLATDYKYNADYTEVTIHLRPRVTWSDGQSFTASDVVFTLDMLLTHAPKLTWSADIARYVKGARALDDHTVSISLDGPNPRFVENYLLWNGDIGFPMLPQHLWAGQDPVTFTNYDLSKDWPVVTGPWRLVASNSQEKVWDRRDDWWGTKTGFRRLPKMKRIVVLPLYASTQLAEMLINNDVDVTHNPQPADVQVALSKNSKLQVRTPNKSGQWGWLQYGVHQLMFNDATPPFNDPTIRRAISYAINRQQIVNVGFGGQTEITSLPIANFTTELPYYKDVTKLLEANPIDKYDVAKTTQTMTSKGYGKDSGGFWSKGGSRLSMAITQQPGFFDNYLPILVAQLQKAGFDASYRDVSNGSTLQTQGQVNTFMDFSPQDSSHDPYQEMSTFHSRYSAPVGSAAQYPYRWVNSQYDQLIDKMSSVPAPSAEFTKLYDQLMTIWIGELPTVPLFQQFLICPVNTTYWKGWPSSTNPYTGALLWQRGSAGVVINTLEPASKPS